MVKIAGGLQEQLKVVSFNARGVDASRARRFTQTLEEEFRFDAVLVQEYSSSSLVASDLDGHGVFCTLANGKQRRAAIIIHRDFLGSVVEGPFIRGRAICMVLR